MTTMSAATNFKSVPASPKRKAKFIMSWYKIAPMIKEVVIFPFEINASPSIRAASPKDNHPYSHIHISKALILSYKPSSNTNKSITQTNTEKFSDFGIYGK